LGRLAIALPGFGINVILNNDHIASLIIIHVKIVILNGTWSDHPGKQFYYEGGMGYPWLNN
jgi:hypothetical protein